MGELHGSTPITSPLLPLEDAVDAGSEGENETILVDGHMRSTSTLPFGSCVVRGWLSTEEFSFVGTVKDRRFEFAPGRHLACMADTVVEDMMISKR